MISITLFINNGKWPYKLNNYLVYQKNVGFSNYL